MKRSAFFKSIATLIAAPKIISEIEPEILIISGTGAISNTIAEMRDTWVETEIPIPSRQLFSDLHSLTPQYYKQYQERYGSELFESWLATYSKTN